MQSRFPNTRAFGLYVENRAVDFFLLIEPRARLVERNFRKRFGEIDLIFSIVPDEWIFVEVRARLGRKDAGPMVSGIESVSWRKQSRLQRVIASFLSGVRADTSRACARLDILDWDGHNFTHYPNVWI